MSRESYHSSGLTATRIGKVVSLSVAKSLSITEEWGTADIGTLPEGFRPSSSTFATVMLQGAADNNVVLEIKAGGTVRIVGKGTSWRSGWLFSLATFLAAA